MVVPSEPISQADPTTAPPPVEEGAGEGTKRKRGAGTAVPRRERRQAARAWLKLGRPTALGEPELPRSERRRQVRAMWAEGIDERAVVVRQGLQALGIRMALQWLHKALEEEADALCGGPKGKHNPHRTGYRHGYELVWVPVGGQRVEIARPRVRTPDGKAEKPLSLYEQVQDGSFFSEAVLMETLAGVSQRRYGVVIETLTPVPEGVNAGSTSKSAVSRRFVAETDQWLKEWLNRPLDRERYLVLFVDGQALGPHHVIAVVGVTERGEKQVLGIWEGATENAEVCRALLEDLVRRGLSAERGLLVVIDGSKALAAAVRAVWGDRVLVQRCVVHKTRNVLEKLPQKRHASVQRALYQAWSAPDARQGEAQLRRLVERLEAKGEEAAARSLAEGMEETLTCVRLNVPAELRKSLRSTNIIESVFSRHEGVAHRVKRWQNGNQALRWAAAALALAERGFHPLGTPEQWAQLAADLEDHARRAALPASA